ncbi:uncharacterized protein ND-MNLL [Cloeon dipterum]|uniref:uncharacterized protein ND-MNLL n=1 Tax=Cloeon dipterum TaxID=197152 RepID=UPI0032203F93
MVLSVVPRLAWMGVPFIGYFIGMKIERMETERLTLYRDKSALYGSPVPPATPTWP